MSIKKTVALFVDDHIMLRQALAKLVCGQLGLEPLQASNGLEAIQILEAQPVDVMVLDVEMPIMDGREVMIEVSKRWPHVKVIVLTLITGVENMLFFIHNGVMGIVLKNDNPDALKLALQAVLQGDKHFTESVLKEITPRLNSIEQQIQKIKLTEREKKLLKQLMAGLSSKEISAQSGVTTKTIDTYRERLLLKTQTENTVALVSFAIKNGLVRI